MGHSFSPLKMVGKGNVFHDTATTFSQFFTLVQISQGNQKAKAKAEAKL